MAFNHWDCDLKMSIRLIGEHDTILIHSNIQITLVAVVGAEKLQILLKLFLIKASGASQPGKPIAFLSLKYFGQFLIIDSYIPFKEKPFDLHI